MVGERRPNGADRAVIDRVDFQAPKMSYPIHFGRGVLQGLRQLKGRTVSVVTTPTVFSLYGTQLIESLRGVISPADVLVLDCDEKSKDMEQVQKVCTLALPRLGRDGVIVGFGGGVVLDIVCFAASMIRRGIGYVKIPTTLIGQIDAGIGIKGGVNFEGKKSYLGCFYAPEQVLIDPAFLATLDRQHLCAGVAEIIKMAVVSDGRFFAEVEKMGVKLIDPEVAATAKSSSEIIIRSINLMMDALRPNLTERASYERIVDFGHTFSPALESALDFEVPHGFCVAVDMALSAAISVERGQMERSEYARLLAALVTVDLPVWQSELSAELCKKAIIDATAHRGGRLNLVIPTKMGASNFIKSPDEIEDGVLEAALHMLARDHVALRKESRSRGSADSAGIPIHG